MVGLISMALLLGDSTTTQMPTMDMDNSHSLLIRAHVCIPMVAVLPNHLVVAPPGTVLGPYRIKAPDTEEVQPCITQVMHPDKICYSFGLS